ncbi:MAG: serine protease [Planctomycetaceae bacterium]|nr:serine protease [Planctomycetaceae bacterium]
MVESLLLAVTRVTTVNDVGETMTNATGFFYERDGQLFLVTNRHVVLSEETGHHPHSLLIELHIDPENVAAVLGFSIPLYHDAEPAWQETSDVASLIDVVTIPLDRDALPETLVYEAFTPAHLVQPYDRIEVGTSLLIVGFPLGFHDSLHHLPVARQAVVASAFGMRFQGNGYFLTDARLHRGTSGAPVVAAISPALKKVGNLSWMLLGIHASRLDVHEPDLTQDERLGLNCAWYADVLASLTEPPALTESEPPEVAVAASA